MIGLGVFYCLLIFLIYAIAHEQFRYAAEETDGMNPSMIIGEMVDETVVEQKMTVSMDRVDAVSLMFGTYDRDNSGNINLEFVDGDTVLSSSSIDANTVKNNAYTTIYLNEPLIGYKNQKVLMRVISSGSLPGSSVTLFGGNTITAGRVELAYQLSEDDYYTVNGEQGNGALCVKLKGVNFLNFYRYYWTFTLGILAISVLLVCKWWKEASNGKNNPLVSFCTMITRYDFLIRQLVSRDFKTKYKRSVLGVAWSFLNPLLTMGVQYIVFSTIFKSNIDNYPVYLLTGTVFMNYLGEAVQMGMISITSNASLIKKVYVPKYIYPITRVMSSSINFFLSLIPLTLVMLMTSTRVTPALFLLIFDFICFLGFITGMCLILTTAMTFFQDTQFLWTVLNMLWLYLTPVFYPDTIIPPAYLGLYRINPMYQYITFARTCIIKGISPGPESYIWCLGYAIIFLLIGSCVFKKHQDKFVLYL